MNEIDVLMNKLREAQPLSNTEIDSIIEDQIKRLALYNSGVKPKKANAEKVDVSEAMQKILSNLTKAKPQPAFKRRI